MTSTTTPNLQVPQHEGRAERSGGGPKLAWVYLFLIAIVGLQVWSLTKGGTVAGGPTTSVNPAGDAEAEQKLAMKLEDRNLPEAAVSAWERYLALAQVDAEAEGNIRYRMGKLQQQAERFEDAVAEYYRAEALLGDQAGDLSQKIAVRVRECMRKMGKYSDLSREMAERANVEGEAGGQDLPGRQVVAEIGDEKITVADFDRMLTEQIEQMVAMRVGMDDEQAEEMRQQAHAQFADPQAKVKQLQEFVGSRVLAEEARKQGLDEPAAFRRQIMDFADRLLAARLMVEEVGRRASVTPQDVERYYKANVAAYTEPTQVRIAHVQCASKEKADEVLAKAQAGEDFGELAKTYSADESTKEKGGVLEQRVAEAGDFVPGVGRDAELHAAVMGAADGAVLARAYKSDKGWHVVKVVGRDEGRVLPFDEVREEVAQDVASERRQEVTQQYVKELLEANRVKFYPQAFAGGSGG